MSDAESRAWDRSDPGTGPTPKYEGPNKAVLSGSRIQTPPIVEDEDETLEEILAKQAGRRD